MKADSAAIVSNSHAVGDVDGPTLPSFDIRRIRVDQDIFVRLSPRDFEDACILEDPEICAIAADGKAAISLRGIQNAVKARGLRVL